MDDNLYLRGSGLMSMDIYLASRYSRREEMKKNRDRLEAMGHRVTSRWIDFADMPETFEWYDPAKHGTDDSGHAAPEYRANIARTDAEDVMRANCCILFTPSGTRGGCHVEFGIALGLGIRTIVCGPRGNIFHNHPAVEVYDDFDAALAKFETEPDRGHFQSSTVMRSYLDLL